MYSLRRYIYLKKKSELAKKNIYIIYYEYDTGKKYPYNTSANF